MSWQWVSCDGGVCRTIVYADSLSPVSRDDYRFSDHPQLVQQFRDSIAKVAALDCDILLTPHPSASKLDERLALGEPLLDTGGCKAYAAQLGKALDDRLAKEAAAKK
jgi:metallo-beta-lactamase class B